MMRWARCQNIRKRSCIPSELVTVGLLVALRDVLHVLSLAATGILSGDREDARTDARCKRALWNQRHWCQRFLARPTLLTVIDSYGIELLHPVREGRTTQPLGKKGLSNRRWIVGVKLC